MKPASVGERTEQISWADKGKWVDVEEDEDGYTTEATVVVDSSDSEQECKHFLLLLSSRLRLSLIEAQA